MKEESTERLKYRLQTLITARDNILFEIRDILNELQRRGSNASTDLEQAKKARETP